MTIQILVTDPSHAIVGDPISDWTELDLTVRFNEPASGHFRAPAWPYIMAQLQPGNRVTIIRDGVVWCTGPLELPQEYVWGLGDSDASGVGVVTAQFTDDLAAVAGHVTWPSPASSWSAQPFTASRVIDATNSETIIRTLVNENAGPGALAARQIPGLALGAIAGAGSITTVTTRFEPVLDACRRAAVNGGNIGFRTRVDGTSIIFECYAPVDRTATARFAQELGNLRSVMFKRSAPTATHALVAGIHTEADAGADPPVAESRTFVEVADTAEAAEWWRVERYVDGSAENDTKGELTSAGDEELANGAALVELATVTVDTEDLRAGRDFGLGDKVTISLPTGVEVTDLVRAIHLQATPDSGEYVSTLIGSPEATSAPGMVRLVRELGRRLGRLAAR